jgi:hypothetical protein
MAAPNVAQGILNRTITSVQWPNFPQLNVTASFMGKRQARIRFDGEATTRIPTATGVVQSPEPYQPVMLSITLLRTQGLANLYEIQRQTLSLLGPGIMYPDTSILTSYQLQNCSIQNVTELEFAGETPDYVAEVAGYYPINNAMWNGGVG